MSAGFGTEAYRHYWNHTALSYRIAELQAGFHSHLFNDEGFFMVLEGTVMSIVAIALTVLHPGLVFRRQWRDTDYSFRTPRNLRVGAATRDRSHSMKARGCPVHGLVPEHAVRLTAIMR